jgi:hypothetical protein
MRVIKYLYQAKIYTMKNFLFLCSVLFFTSCSAVYKSGQTPDDLYYSKPKVVLENTNRYEKLDNVYEERQIRMAAYDYRWRSLDDRYDYNYSYHPYNYGYNYGYYYNPYYCSYPVYGQSALFVNPKNTTIRTTNLTSYNNTVSGYTPSKASGSARTIIVRGYNNSNNQTIRNNTYDTRTYNENRSYTPSSNSNNNNNSNNSSAPASKGSSVPRPSRGQ